MKNFYYMPSYIDNRDFRFLNIDNTFVGFLEIKDYPKAAGFIEILEYIPKKYNFEYSIHIKKQDTNKLLKEITYSISSNVTEIKDSKKNQIDIDILDNVTEDAKKMRKSIQLDNEEIFYVSFIFSFFSKSKDELLNLLKEFQSKLYSKNVISNILNFRCLDSYVSTLPLNYIDKNLFKTSYKNFTTSNLLNLFPFYTRNYFDNNGVLFGYTLAENNLCYINIFNDKYLNSNMCIFGSSGSGKSYFVKLLIIKHYFNNFNQFILDPENEYSDIVNSLSGIEINFKNNNNVFYNIFDIRKEEINLDNFLDIKINIITEFILNLIEQRGNFSYSNFIKKSIYNMYKRFKIIDSNNNLLDKKDEKVEFPTILDLYKSVKDNNLKKLIKIKIIEKFNIFCNNTNIDISNKLVSFNLSNLNLNEAIAVLKYLSSILNNIKSFKNNTVIYFDEIWKYISSHNLNIAQEIFSLFKTIRKKNAGIVTITQDIYDFFNYKNGSYGKSILNNSFFKVLFKMEYSDINILKNLNLYDESSILKLSTLEKGNLFLGFKFNNCFLKVKSNSFEEKILKGG